MRRHLNTLYVNTDGSWLRKDGENVVLQVKGQELARAPLHMLAGIVCVGNVSMSPALMGHCAAQGLTITFLSVNGRFQARVEGPVSGNVLLRRQQYRLAEGNAGADIVSCVLLGKIHNQRAVVRRALRDHREGMIPDAVGALDRVERRLGRLLDSVQAELQTIDVLRGIEGEAAQCYFSVFGHLIRSDEDAFQFGGRSRRPPRDAANAVLSFLYTVLTHDCRSALESVGLDPAVGFLHRDRPGRPSLALDLAEEFRPVLADRVALTLINRRQLKAADFRFFDGGGVLLSDEARKNVLVAYQERKSEELRHPFLDEPTTAGLLPLLQAQLLARHIRGDVDAYPPYLWK